MPRDNDLRTMIEALTLTISVHEGEEAFFRRSAMASSDQDVKTQFLEIAAEMTEHLAHLEARKQKLMEALVALQQKSSK